MSFLFGLSLVQVLRMLCPSFWNILKGLPDSSLSLLGDTLDQGPLNILLIFLQSKKIWSPHLPLADIWFISSPSLQNSPKRCLLVLLISFPLIHSSAHCHYSTETLRSSVTSTWSDAGTLFNSLSRAATVPSYWNTPPISYSPSLSPTSAATLFPLLVPHSLLLFVWQNSSDLGPGPFFFPYYKYLPGDFYLVLLS